MIKRGEIKWRRVGKRNRLVKLSGARMGIEEISGELGGHEIIRGDER